MIDPSGRCLWSIAMKRNARSCAEGRRRPVNCATSSVVKQSGMVSDRLATDIPRVLGAPLRCLGRAPCTATFLPSVARVVPSAFKGQWRVARRQCAALGLRSGQPRVPSQPMDYIGPQPAYASAMVAALTRKAAEEA